MKEFTAKDLDNFEIMDRTWMVMCHLNDALYDNPIVPKKTKKKIKKAYQLLFDVYQEAGSKLP